MTHLGKLVQVEWEDSFGCSAHWEAVKDIKCEPCIAMSVGWVFAESETGILIVPHRVSAEGEDQGCGDMVIPRSCILHIRELRTCTDTCADTEAPKSLADKKDAPFANPELEQIK